jgi:molecular chaperone DnaK (HSP70)
MLSDVFYGKELCSSIDADLAVAEGAAIRGAILSGVSQGLLKVRIVVQNSYKHRMCERTACVVISCINVMHMKFMRVHTHY